MQRARRGARRTRRRRCPATSPSASSTRSSVSGSPVGGAGRHRRLQRPVADPDPALGQRAGQVQREQLDLAPARLAQGVGDQADLLVLLRRRPDAGDEVDERGPLHPDEHSSGRPAGRPRDSARRRLGRSQSARAGAGRASRGCLADNERAPEAHRWPCTRSPASRPRAPSSSTCRASCRRTTRSGPTSSDPAQRVAFGTSGHRGSVAQGRVQRGAHPRDEPGHRRAPAREGHRRAALPRHGHARALRAGVRLGARGARGQRRRACAIQSGRRYTPTPAVSHAILTWNRGRKTGLADGIVITPSHNPPDDGGFKYNPPDGGPADTDVTKAVESRANAILEGGLREREAHRRSRRRCARTRRASTTSSTRTSPTSRASSTWRRSPAHRCTSASTLSAARRSTTGRRSPSATG